MDSIAGFVAEFSENIAQYTEIKKELEKSCQEKLRGISFFWESRVKDLDSLREKLQKRQSKYRDDESANVADIRDLVGGRIIFYNWQDLERIQSIINEVFKVKERSQLPRHAMDITERFRGYSGLHFHIIWPHFLEESRSDLVLEIQVMSPCMWWFSKMEHDVVYKEKNGPPSKRLRTLIEILKANVNQAEVVSQEIEEVQLEDINKRVRRGLEELEPQRQLAGLDFRAAVEKLAHGVTDHLLQQHSDYLARIADEMLGSRRDQKEWRQTDKMSQCLQALFKPDCETQKQRNSDRVPGTCQWFLKNKKYHSWIKSQSSDLLWVTADAGCGKSVLAKSLIDDELQSRPSTIIAYFFFKDDNIEQTKITNAICAILHQILFQSGSELQKLAVNAFEKYGEQLAKSYHALWDLLLQVSREPGAGEIVCVLDALDECEKVGQDLLINSLNSFSASPMKNDGRLKILVTSRPYLSIRNRFDGKIIRVAGEDESDLIKPEIDLVIRHMVPQVASRLNLDTRVQDLLERKLLDAENRTYLWIHLILEDILERGARVNTAKKMEHFLTELPTSIYAAYDHMLKRSPKPADAKKLLHIMLAAVRPLHLREMNMAFNIQDGDKSREDVDLDPEHKFATTIRDVCGLFVTVSKADSTIYFIHQTAKEFLISREDASQPPGQNDQSYGTWQHSMKLEDSNHLFTQICFHYLSFSAFEVEPLWMQPDTKHHGFRMFQNGIHVDTNKFELFDYVAKHWHDHFRLARKDPPQIQVWLHVCSINTWNFKVWSGMYLHKYTRGFFKIGTDLGITPLMLASLFGHTTIVEFLANGNDLEKKDSCGRTALWWAARGNHHHVLGQLLDKGASVNSADSVGVTPLVVATLWGDRAMMQTLIEHHALVDGASASGWKETVPIFCAISTSRSQQECISRLDLLISNRANIDLTNSGHQTILQKAMTWQMYDVARWLISKGAMDQLFSNKATHDRSLKQLTILYGLAKKDGAEDITDKLIDRAMNQLFSNKATYDPSPEQLTRLYTFAKTHGVEDIMDKLIDKVGGRRKLE